MTATRTSLADFVARNKITMSVRPGPYSRPDWNGRDPGATHWVCTLRHDGRKTQVTFSMGSAFKGRRPTAEEVLDDLASDAAGLENSQWDFHSWCREYGYDDVEERGKSLRTFNAVKRQTERLIDLLGGEYYTLLWDTDRV